ncbi:hypothetical protein HYH03_007375 [Edaphochlamys debaryana]|uniref:Uncharacterized protein n=1 Tax=Edaphochlamys debaryana TaxID=47281 RepID=A0A835Y2A4_9CHLO|nr:hypothetical protein HYH03_007375 [Edaphochlamys debaryana]|eukprot:KAG2494610.1 hypothetical protein HYH03_007375 [Edaphochlamys debaryana]
MGKAVKRGLQSAGHAVARTFFRGTGAHFLALDGAPGLLPLLVRLAMDCPDRGEYFFSALRAFATRACYGNVKGDHWVSWENATVRPTSKLPAIDPHAVRHGRGVVHEDPVEAGAVRPGHSPKAGPEASGKAKEQEQGQGQEQPRSQEALLEAASHTPPPPERTGSSVPVAGATGREGGKGQGPTEGAAADGAADGLSEAALAEEVEREDESPEQVSALALARLQQLPWRRVDCSFGGAWMGTSHNNIQATRWTNLVGRSVLAHLHAHLQASEALLARMEAWAAAQGVAAVPDSAGEAAAPAGAGQGSG